MTASCIVLRAFVAYRKEVKKRGTEVDTPWYAAKLAALAKRLWEKRGSPFTSDDHLTPKGRAELLDVVAHNPFLGTVRAFLYFGRSVHRTDASLGLPSPP